MDLIIKSGKNIYNQIVLNKRLPYGTLQTGGISVSIEKAIEIAATSVEMEGFRIDEQSREWCRQLLREEITMEQYIRLVKQKVGVPA